MRGPRRRRVYDALNVVARRVLGETIKAGPARGMRFRGGDTAGYVLGLSEPAVQEAMVAHLRPGDVYVDVGTHAGFLALLGSRLVGDGGQVHCFEPVSGNVAMLEHNLALNAATNVRVHRLALGDRDAMACMDVSSYITASLADGSHGEQVRVARLDSLSGLPTIRLMKIDVEGAESEVLDGARRTLERDHPVLLVEIHGDREQSVRAVLREAGYPEPTMVRDGGMPHLIAVPGR